MKKKLSALFLLVAGTVLLLTFTFMYGGPSKTDELRDTSRENAFVGSIAKKPQEKIIELNGEMRRAEYSMGEVDWYTYHGKVGYVISGTAYKVDSDDLYADPISFRIDYKSKDDLGHDPLVIWLGLETKPLIGMSWQIDPEYPNGWIYYIRMSSTSYDLTFYTDGVKAEETGSLLGVLSEDMADRHMTTDERDWTLNTARSLTGQLWTK